MSTGAVAELGRGVGAVRRMSRRVWAVLLGAWAAITGIAPHVLHHAGPLAGAALLAGTGGRLLFAAIGLVVSLPFLIRIKRRFRTWLAPAIALTLMAVTFLLSTFVIGPAITGGEGGRTPSQQPAGHLGHHGG